MPRDTDGNYSKANPDVQTGFTISSTEYNSSNDDVATEMTDSLSRSGKGGMSAALKAADGTDSAPGYTFTAEVGTGLGRDSSTGNPFLSRVGARIMEWFANTFRIGTSSDYVDIEKETRSGSNTTVLMSTLRTGTKEGRVWVLTDASGNTKYLFGRKADWEAANPSFGNWPDSSATNEFHVCQNGNLGVEFESGNDDIELKLECGSATNNAIVFLENGPDSAFTYTFGYNGSNARFFIAPMNERASPFVSMDKADNTTRFERGYLAVNQTTDTDPDAGIRCSNPGFTQQIRAYQGTANGIIEQVGTAATKLEFKANNNQDQLNLLPDGAVTSGPGATSLGQYSFHAQGQIASDNLVIVNQPVAGTLAMRVNNPGFTSKVELGYGSTNVLLEVNTALPFEIRTNGATNNDQLVLLGDGGLSSATMKSGTSQANAGAAANELWVDTSAGNVVKRGV